MRFVFLALALFSLAAGAVVPTVNLDPTPGTIVGQRVAVVNRAATSVTVAGTTGILLPAAVTLAAGESLSLQWDGLHWVLPGSAGTVTRINSFTWDFPALGNTTLAIPCSETATETSTDTLIGDRCDISSNLGTDGGAMLLSTARLTCRAVTAGVVAQLCVQLTDGGSYDLGDAGFTTETRR